MERTSEGALLRAEHLLDKYCGKSLARAVRRDLLECLAEVDAVSNAAAVAALQQRVSFSFIPRITDNHQLVESASILTKSSGVTDNHQLVGSASTPTTLSGVTDSHQLAGGASMSTTASGFHVDKPCIPRQKFSLLYTMPSQVDRAFLLRPIPPGKHLQCLLVRQRSTLTRFSPSFLFSLVCVSSSAPTVALSPIGEAAARQKVTTAPLFLLGAKRASSSSPSSSLSSLASSSSSSSSSSSMSGGGGNGATYFVYSTEKHDGGGRSGGWQEKGCFGWVRGLGSSSATTTTATVNELSDSSSNAADSLSENMSRSSVPKDSFNATSPPLVMNSAGGLPPIESSGHSIAIQVASEGPDRLLKLTAVLPPAQLTAVPGKDEQQSPLRSSLVLNDDDSLGNLYREATEEATLHSGPSKNSAEAAGAGACGRISSDVSNYLVLRSKVPRWGVGSVCGVDSSVSSSSPVAASHYYQQQQQQPSQQQQQQQQQRSGYSLDFEWRESRLDPSRKNVALVCSHPAYRTRSVQTETTGLVHRDLPLAGDAGTRSSGVGGGIGGALIRSRISPPSLSAAAFSPTSTRTVLVRAGELGAPPGLWKRGVALSEPESDRGTVDLTATDCTSATANNDRGRSGDSSRDSSSCVGGVGGVEGSGERSSSVVLKGGGAATVFQIVKIDAKKVARDNRQSAHRNSLSGPMGGGAEAAAAGGTAFPPAATAPPPPLSGQDHFRVDATAPLSPFQAFALALAVFEGQ